MQGHVGGRRSVIATVLSCCVLAALTVATHQAYASTPEPGFQPALDVSPGYLYTYPRMVPDADGGLLYSWVENPTYTPNEWVSRVEFVPAVGGSLQSQVLSGNSAGGVALDSDGHGNAIAVWVDYCCDGRVIRVASKRPGEQFGSDAPLMEAGTQIRFLGGVAMSGSGESIILFSPYGTTKETLWAIFASASGQYSDPVLVSSDVRSNAYGDYAVALSENGEAVVAWGSKRPVSCEEPWDPKCEPDTRPWQMRATIGSRNGFSEPQTLSVPETPTEWGSLFPTVDIDPTGGAVVAWEDNHGDGVSENPAYVSLRRPGRQFQSSPTLVGHSLGWSIVDSGLADDGRGLASFVDAGGRASVVSVNTATGRILPAAPIITSAAWARMAVNSEGQALLATQTYIDLDYQPAGISLWAVWGDVGGSFGPVRNLSCPPPDRNLHDVTLDHQGHGAVLFQDPGANLSEDDDDRMWVRRSSVAIPPSNVGCPNAPARRAPPPPTVDSAAPRPRGPMILRFVGPSKLRMKGKRIRVRLSSNTAGRVTITGTAVIRDRDVRLAPSTVEFQSAGEAVGSATLPRPIVAAVKRGKPVKLNLEGVIRTGPSQVEGLFQSVVRLVHRPFR